jgi:hypothetical protein
MSLSIDSAGVITETEDVIEAEVAEKTIDLWAVLYRVMDLEEKRDRVVQDFTGRMQAETVPSKVLKLALKLSAATFEIDRDLAAQTALLDAAGLRRGLGDYVRGLLAETEGV